MADERTSYKGANDKVSDSEIQGDKAGKKMRETEAERDDTSPAREGRPSEYPASKAGVDRPVR